MNIVTELDEKQQRAFAPFFIKGELIEGSDVVHRSRDLGVDFATPDLKLNSLVSPRTEPGPLFDIKLGEIIDFLVECGENLELDKNDHLQTVVERMSVTNILPRRVIENQIRLSREYLRRDLLLDVVEQNFPNPAVLDDWVVREDRQGRKGFVRAFPPRLIHVLPGNSPIVSVQSVAWTAMVKAINVFKMGSSDPYTMVAILRTMAEVDPEHPVVKSMSAVYWRGGDERVERTLYRPQYFDKLVAWGGGDAINNVVKYMGPGFQLISFDPKTSISMVGREVFDSNVALEEAADGAARDVSILNQEACVASRFIFIEGETDQVDRFCERLHDRLGVDRDNCSAEAPPLDVSLTEEIEALRLMDDDFRVWGLGSGNGLVIRSEEPVDFHPINKTANVVKIASLDDAMRYVNVATQTVGVYPYERAFNLRNRLASGGAQRIVRLGDCGGGCAGNPHDAMYPLNRFVHWIAHEDGWTKG